jgi:hypothetical protein
VRAKGVDDLDRAINLAVVEVFRAEDRRAQLLRSGDDGAVVIHNLVAAGIDDAGLHQRCVDWDQQKARQRLDPAISFVGAAITRAFSRTPSSMANMIFLVMVFSPAPRTPDT